MTTAVKVYAYLRPSALRSGATRQLASASSGPVATGDGGRLRFESVSGCRGVYARLDRAAGTAAAAVPGLGTATVAGGSTR